MAGRGSRDGPIDFQGALDRQLKQQGDITLKAFEDKYTPTGCGDPYLDRVSFDVRRAKFWDLLQVDIDEYNRERPKRSRGQAGERMPAYRMVDSRLSEEGLRHMQRDGFAVGQPRFGSFGDAFHQIYSDDLPV
ncbi:unnamed protein product [Ostreobium quekettii]|uniref:Uncharacterized protein n=1 Tax=Ostreobium quekettii TaxID=121088 RepID=A0A8S1J0Z6_9CHLO|nr:unnamed protein product [Ostreobium quekettii]